MPRIAEAREAAAPNSPSQKERRRRILRAAANLAAEKGLDRVQMQEVAKDAGVAIGTLYRYFPSKTYLFTAVLADQVDWLDEHAPVVRPGQDPEEAVYELLIGAGRQLLRRPTLATALFQSANSAHAVDVPEAGHIDRTFRNLVLKVLGIPNPTAQDVTSVWLLIQCWYGLLTSTLNGRTSNPDAEADLRVACRLLLAPAVARESAAELPVTGRSGLRSHLAG